MLCRNNQDCTWMDRSMHCEDYELDFNINRGWYGGDYLAVVGECECDTWSRWDNWDLQCEFSFFASKESVSVLCSLLSLVERFMVLLRQLSFAPLWFFMA